MHNRGEVVALVKVNIVAGFRNDFHLGPRTGPCHPV